MGPTLETGFSGLALQARVSCLSLSACSLGSVPGRHSPEERELERHPQGRVSSAGPQPDDAFLGQGLLLGLQPEDQLQQFFSWSQEVPLLSSLCVCVTLNTS